MVPLQIPKRGLRRWQARTHMMRRLKEDRNQHFTDLSCPCWLDPKFMARFREQPKLCSCALCGNPRRYAKGAQRFTLAERRALASDGSNGDRLRSPFSMNLTAH